MRTAEEILRSNLPKDCIWDEEHDGEGEWNLTNTPSKYVRKAINEARIEAIKECAEAVSIIMYEYLGNTQRLSKTGEDIGKYIMEENGRYEVNKSEILKLIDQVK